MRRAAIVLLVCLALLGAKRRSVRTDYALPGRDHERSVTVAGLRHDFHVYVPSAYNGTRATPLLLFFHGGGGNAEQGERTVNLRATAEKHGFLLVRPEGYDRLGLGIRTWNAGECCGVAMNANIDHVGAVRAILDRVAGEWRVDAARVFATGHSNGGMMSYRLACELADRIAAIAPNAASLVYSPCTPSRPVALMHMHGDADTCSPINGGVSTGFEKTPRPPVSDAISRFIAVNGASATSRVSYENREVTCVTHDAPDKADVVLCVANGGGHAWPGAAYERAVKPMCGGNAIEGLNANEVIWQFFSSR